MYTSSSKPRIARSNSLAVGIAASNSGEGAKLNGLIVPFNQKHSVSAVAISYLYSYYTYQSLIEFACSATCSESLRN